MTSVTYGRRTMMPVILQGSLGLTVMFAIMGTSFLCKEILVKRGDEELALH